MGVESLALETSLSEECIVFVGLVVTNAWLGHERIDPETDGSVFWMGTLGISVTCQD